MKDLLLLTALTLAGAPQTLAEPMSAPAALPELPPLERVLAAALDRAPEIRVRQALVAKNEALLERTRREWLDDVALGATYQAGDQLYLSSGSDGAERLSRSNSGFAASVSVRLSLYDLVGRPAQIRAAREEVAIARAQRDVATDETGRDVVALYRRTEAALRLLAQRAESAEATRGHRMLAEAQFASGDLPLGEVARVTEIAANAAAAFEVARSEYLASFGQLEIVVGAPLGTLAAVSGQVEP